MRLEEKFDRGKLSQENGSKYAEESIRNLNRKIGDNTREEIKTSCTK